MLKRPRDQVHSLSLGFEQNGSLGRAVDIGQRQGRVGWRINAGAERLDPTTRDSRGDRHLLAAAADWQAGPGSLLEAEIEWSRQSQPSTPGFSPLGDRLPDARSVDPRLNLNNQDWSPPVVMYGQTGSMRYTQALSSDIKLVAHAMRQRLDSDDRIAFPFVKSTPRPTSQRRPPPEGDESSGQPTLTHEQTGRDGRQAQQRRTRLAVGCIHQSTPGMA